MRRKYNPTGFRITKTINRWARNKFAPDPLKKWEQQGVIGKGIKKIAGNMITTPLRQVSYASTGTLYNPKTDHPSKGSLLYTGFHWGYLLIMLACPPALMLFIFTGAVIGFKKLIKRGKNGNRH